ncbi:MAG: hypothetical protein MI753_19725 [Hyphomicrobiales bacterium]|nr:hypothetical protein [Hyphomicrobiales bacterium]
MPLIDGLPELGQPSFKQIASLNEEDTAGIVRIQGVAATIDGDAGGDHRQRVSMMSPVRLTVLVPPLVLAVKIAFRNSVSSVTLKTAA